VGGFFPPQRNRVAHPDLRAVGAQVALLDDGRGPAFDHADEGPDSLGQVVGMREILDPARQHLLARAADQLAIAVVDQEVAAIGIHLRDADAGAVEQPMKARMELRVETVRLSHGRGDCVRAEGRDQPHAATQP
jgi:hypothetical protein